MPKIQYCISLWNYTHYLKSPKLDRLIESIKINNYGVEIWNLWKNEFDLYDSNNRKKIKQVLKNISVSYHTEIGLIDLDEHKKQIDVAADLNATVLVLHSDNLYLPESKKLDIELTEKIIDYASARNIVVTLENGQLPFLVDAITKVPKLNICLDIGHVYLVEETMSQFLEILKGKITHLHIQEILSEPELILLNEENIIVDHYTPGTGGIPSKDWILLSEMLKDIKYQGMAVFEIQPRNPLQTALLGKNFMDDLFIL